MENVALRQYPQAPWALKLLQAQLLNPLQLQWPLLAQLSQLSGPVLAWLSGLVLFQACGDEPKSKATCKKWGRFLRIVISHLKSKCCLLLDTDAYSIHVTNTEFLRMNITLTSTDLLPDNASSLSIHQNLMTNRASCFGTPDYFMHQLQCLLG